ncbi:MAG: rhodanese-like domain-containing protein [Gammaproteobacteria bacterium]|nr:rhodanese-like domain-containing protein [Gammaproteobacteria bacterium]
MKTFNELIADAVPFIKEVFPWDLDEKINSDNKPLIVDIREAGEYEAMHIADSIFIPRGLLEQACEWDYDNTIPELVKAREREVVVVCRSGSRSVMAALTMHLMGYQNVASLKTGVRGWNDYDQPMINSLGNEVDPDEADEFLSNKIREDQMKPKE